MYLNFIFKINILFPNIYLQDGDICHAVSQ